MARFIFGLMFLVAFLPRPTQAGPPTKPAEVLPYLESVYKAGDIDAYADLLTEDFKFTLEDMAASWDKAADVRGTRKLFEAAKVELSFSKDVSIKPGTQPGTWLIETAGSTLQVTQKKDNKVYRVEIKGLSFVVRDENGTLRIVEWRQKE